jgi:PKHD-type hydroxylase
MAALMDRGRVRPYFRAAMTSQDENRRATQTFTAWADAFTPAELDAIEAYGDALAPEPAVVLQQSLQGDLVGKLRVTQTARFPENADTKWIYDRVQSIARSLNDASYQYDLRGFAEEFQYSVYRDAEGGHYDWHVDHGPLTVQRKLSLSVQLSPADAYQGCDLQFVAGNRTETGPRERGTVIAFPSYVLHRVTPIVSGTRKALVVWTTGPNFR